MNEPLKDMEQAYKLVDKMKARADSHAGVAPLWHGWALREAFLEGVKWERDNYRGEPDGNP